MARTVKLDIVGTDALTATVKPRVWKARIESAMDIIVNDAASLLAEATPVGVYGAAQGAWLQTRGVEVSETQVVGFSDPTPSAPYIWFVINGTKPAKRNPGLFIARWVEKKLSVTTQYRIALGAGMSKTTIRRLTQEDKLAATIGFLIGRKRMKVGSPANDFITPIVEKNQAAWEQILMRAGVV